MPLVFEPQLLRCRAAGPGGRWLNVLLDTGTDPSAIDLRLAQRLGLRLGDFAFGQDAICDVVPFTETVVPWLRLGDLYLRDLFALALDLHAAPFNVDVILGYNVLRQVVLHVDYSHHLIRLSHPDLGTVTQDAPDVVLPLTFFEHFPALEHVTLCNAIDLPLVTIDTGSNGGLTLGPDLAARVGLRREAANVTLAYGTGFSNHNCDILCGKADSLRVGPFALGNVELDTPGSGGGDLQRPERANIGNRLLARFARLTLDYARSQCALNL